MDIFDRYAPFVREYIYRSGWENLRAIQVAAANAALNAFGRELLAEHIRTCVVHDIQAGREETVDDLITILQKLMK